MNIDMKYQSKLSMLDMYFSHFEFKNKRKIESTKLKVNYKVRNRIDENQNTQINILTIIESEDESIYLELEAVGIFNLVGMMDDKIKREILNKNTVAIMLPFIRSQISLITTQPGFSPILLPLIDVNELIGNKE